MVLKHIGEITVLTKNLRKSAYGLTTRLGGVSAAPYHSLNMGFQTNDWQENIIENKERLATAIKHPREDFICGYNTHTTNVAYVTKLDCGAGLDSFESGINETDGLYTNESGVVLSCYHADCAPIYLHSKDEEWIGLIHAGWKGSVNGIVSEMIKVWVEDLSINPEDIYMHIGPHISERHYEIGPDVMKLVDELTLPHILPFYKKQGARYFLNIRELNIAYALSSQVPLANISYDSYCTFKDSDLFFSYRKEGQTGRMQSFFYKKKD